VRQALKHQGCWHPSLGSSTGDGQDDARMLVSLEERCLRSQSERAQLLDTLVFEKLIAVRQKLTLQTFLISDSLVPSANLGLDLEQGEVGKRRGEC